MRKIQETLQPQSSTNQDIMYIAFELSNSTWRMAFSDGNKKRHVNIKARDLKQLGIEIDKAYDFHLAAALWAGQRVNLPYLLYALTPMRRWYFEGPVL